MCFSITDVLGFFLVGEQELLDVHFEAHLYTPPPPTWIRNGRLLGVIWEPFGSHSGAITPKWAHVDFQKWFLLKQTNFEPRFLDIMRSVRWSRQGGSKIHEF